MMDENKQIAYFAGGCFWGVEYYFSQKPGVISTEAGYMGGDIQSPCYEEVKTGKTGHLEVVKVVFNPKEIDYMELAKLFFEIHDPTQTDGQGVDIGTQYLSAIFYLDEAQKCIAQKLIDQLRQKGLDVVTKLIDAAGYTFWVAENYHQQYFSKLNQAPTCHIPVKRF
ncbi:peptide-methionine (S)-S-oxide reductase MsrA [Facilibium subflavum]|uniref:peptide-methionine (S)-S-oxide reductase MsrA n=1 Tax=Facilibium subflavum TaxID=2219058 RepID=UPI000E65BA24|nr:peptide-methionine (S)-S-oxide reductase MsrA [Facilibium subflavum]